MLRSLSRGRGGAAPSAAHVAGGAARRSSAGGTIEFSGVSFSYGGPCSSLSDVTFSIAAGEFIALVGANGAGKSTASKLMNGLLRPASGQVTVAGLPTAGTRTSTLARHVGYLFQNPDRQICQHTVGREIRFGLELLGIDGAEADRRISDACDMFGLAADANPFALSRGERQRVALASILAGRPEILVLDEPTTGLDARESRTVLEHIEDLNRVDGTTVVMVSHDMDAVARYATRALVLAEGELIADAPADSVLRDAAVMERASLVPPQIHELSGRLAADYPALAEVTCPAEMARLVIDLAEGGPGVEKSA